MAATATGTRRVAKRFVHVWEGVTWHAVVTNVVLRVAIVIFTADAVIHASDPRFAGKGLSLRNIGIVFGFTMLFPLLQAVYGRWKRYPMWWENLYLSIFALDMAGNTFNLYDSWLEWDHIPHTHGPGALALVLIGAFGFRAIAAAGLATMLHLWLEIEEFYGDVLFHTHNVRDTQDQMNDLLFGLIGVILYTVLFVQWQWLKERRARAGRGRRTVRAA